MLTDRDSWTAEGFAVDMGVVIPARTEAGRGPSNYRRLCRALKATANITIGIAVAGMAWSAYDFDGYGPTVTFSGFVVYLILVELRARLACA